MSPSEVATYNDSWRMRLDVPGSRTCIETMQSWMEGEPVWPYERIIETWGPEYEDIRKQWARMRSSDIEAAIVDMCDVERAKARIGLTAALYEVRSEYVARYGFMIPCAELLDALGAHAPIVEVGAGSGYMTHLMRARGIDAIGSDIDGYQNDSGHGFIVGEHDPEQVNGVEAKTMVRRYPDRTVFACWPTYRHTWLRQAMRAMAVGQKLIVTREDCIGSESAWNYLDSCFEELQVIDLPVFPHIHDYAGVYVKRAPKWRSRNSSS